MLNRYNKIRRLTETDEGAFRINWRSVEDQPDAVREGAWAYDNRDEAESDAERFEKMPFCAVAWVEERDQKAKA